MLPIAQAAVSLLVFSNTSVTTLGDKQLPFINDVTPISTSVTVAKQSQKADVITASVKKDDKPSAPAPVIVTVEKGDTLSSIAEHHNTTYGRLFRANDVVTDPNVINPGQQLRIPEPSENLPDRALPQTSTQQTPRATSSVATTVAYVAPAVSGNDAKAFIYSRESGNNPNATNPSGCYGLGQDCNGVLRSQCGADYACQDAYFTDYAMRRYGSWEAALGFWQVNGWW